jgi:hypothetical protein
MVHTALGCAEIGGLLCACRSCRERGVMESWQTFVVHASKVVVEGS